jgi:hypothetical protein
MSVNRRAVLLIAQDTPGILWPLLRLGREWQGRGYVVKVLTSSRCAQLVRDLGFEPCSTAGHDSCFDIANWHVAAEVALQVGLVCDAVNQIQPEVVIASQMCISYVFLPRSCDRRLIVLGSFTPLWPRRPVHYDSEPLRGTRAYREQRRLRDWVDVAHRAASSLGTAAPSMDDLDAWYGDAMLIRNVGELDPLPQHHYDKFVFVGDLLFEPEDAEVQAWSEYARSTQQQVIYVQHGRHFGKPPLWKHLDRMLSVRRDPVLIDLCRYDGDRPILQCEAHYRKYVPLLAIIERVRAIVSSGGATTVLAALRHRKPLLVGMVGSGGEELIDLVHAKRLGVVFDPTSEGLPERDECLSDFLQSGPDPIEAARVQSAFAAVNLSSAVAIAMGERR